VPELPEDNLPPDERIIPSFANVVPLIALQERARASTSAPLSVYRYIIFEPGEYRRGVIVAIPVRTSIGIVLHKGILGDLLGEDRFPSVIHSAKVYGNRVVETTMTDFARYGLGTITSEGYPGSLTPDEVLRRARSKMNVPWRVMQNCEHFVGWAHDVPAGSPQLRATVTKAVVIGAAGAGLFTAAVIALGKRRSSMLGAEAALSPRGRR
jgi:hypothetical protein